MCWRTRPTCATGFVRIWAFRRVNARRTSGALAKTAKLFAEGRDHLHYGIYFTLSSRTAIWCVRSWSPEFVEVYVNAPLEICEQRDPKGLYARARANEIKEFTGVSAPYEPPGNADIELPTDQLTVAESSRRLLNI